MLKLRKVEAVETKDFETFKKFFEDSNEDVSYHWLCYDFNYSEKRTEPTEEEKIRIEKEWGNIQELIDKEFKNYTIERYRKDIETSFIFMIERESEILGYVNMYYYTKGQYKICDWAMVDPRDEDTKKEVVAKLMELKLPRLREYSICGAIHLSVILSLWDLGFRPSGSMRTGFWKLEVSNESEKQ